MASSSAVSSDTDSRGKSHIVVYTKSTLAEQAMLAALELTDVLKGKSHIVVYTKSTHWLSRRC